MQQTENAGDNCSVYPTKNGGTSGHASDQLGKERIEVIRQKVNVISSIGMLLLGLLFSYFPQYIQANIPVLSSGAEIMALLFFAGCAKTFYDAYPRLFTQDNLMLLGSLVMSVFSYLLSDPGKSYIHTSVDILVPFTEVDLDVFCRIISFGCLIMFMGILSLRAPSFILFYERRKGKIWGLIASKKSIAPILGGLSVVTAVCTALLQIIQIVSGLLHG